MLKLRLLTGPRAGRQLRVSDTKPVSVGRRVGRLRLHDSRVSKRHAKIFFAGGTWVLRDLGSANGTYVNRRKCDGLVELETGDILQMGRVLIKILQADAVGMRPVSAAPDVTGTQASRIGLDAFSADGPTESGEVDLASILGEDGNDADLLDFSDMSKAGASHAGMSAAGKTQVNSDTLSLEPIELEPADEDADAGGTGDEDDPLLAGVEDEEHGAGEDLVSIEDEDKPRDSPMPGTTLLTAITDDDDGQKPEVVGLRLDQPAPQQPPAADHEPKASHEAQAADKPAKAADASHDLLSVDQPEAAADQVALDSGEVEQPANPMGQTAEETRRASDESLTDFELVDLEQVEALDLEAAHAELAFEDVLDSGAEALDPEAIADELWPEQDEAESKVPWEAKDSTPRQDAEPERAEAHDADEESGQAEPGVEAESEAEVEAHTEIGSEPEAELEIAESDEAQTPDEAPEPVADTGVETPAIAAEVDDVEDADEAETEVEAEDDVASEEDAAPVDGTPPLEPFDIDAAFDKLSEGLDDSVSMPAIRDEREVQGAATSADAEADNATQDDDSAQPHAAEQREAADPDEGADVPSGFDTAALAGSQLDISFIQDALAKLGDEDPDAPAEPGEDGLASNQKQQAGDDTQSATPPQGSSAAVADELSADEIQHAPEAGLLAGEDTAVPVAIPPGLNPTTVVPPAEPNRSYHPVPKRKKGRWFLTLLPILALLGVGAWLVYDARFGGQSVAGREKTPGQPSDDNTQPDNGRVEATPDTTPNNRPPFDGTSDERDPSGLPDVADVVPRQSDPKDNLPPAVAPTPPLQQTLAGSAPAPSLFGEGPAVLGSKALAGLTVTGSGAGIETLPPPRRNNQPGIVIPSTLPDAGSDNTPVGPLRPGNSPDAKPGETDAGTTATTPEINPTPPQRDPAAALDTEARIVFLVDASGSLVDTLPQMLVWLNEAVRTVGPDEQFAILFFKSGKAIETDPAGMLRPTREVLDKLAESWLNPKAIPVMPTGRSHPSIAIAKALSYKPTDIYLLSDESFARFAGDTTRDDAVALVADIVVDSGVRVHGVQFFYRDEGGVLETLADRFDGTFEFVKEAVVAEDEPIDLLEELESDG